MISCKLYLLFSVNYPEMNVPFQGTIHIANIPAGAGIWLTSYVGLNLDMDTEVIFTSFRPFNMLSKIQKSIPYICQDSLSTCSTMALHRRSTA